MTYSKNVVECVQNFILEFASKGFTEGEIQEWAMINLPTYSKDTFYFFKKTLKQFYYSNKTFLLINSMRVNDMWKSNPDFLKKFNELNKELK